MDSAILRTISQPWKVDGHDAIVAHIRVSDSDPRLCAKACESLRKRFAVEYVTLQAEPHDDGDHHH